MTKTINLTVRTATMNDLESITAAEALCFPPAEAAPLARFEQRLHYYPDHFWLLFHGDVLVSFVNGFVTNEKDLTDEMFEKAELHDENGQWQMIFGVITIPDYRRNGHAATLLNRVIQDARSQGRRGIVLTCKDHMVSYYARFGFVNEGVSQYSNHGGAVWNQMRLTFS